MERVSLFLLSLLPFCLSFDATHQINPDESALLAFKSLVTSDPHNYLIKNWTSGTSVCTWRGVTCDPRRNRVTHLDLLGMELGGCIAPEIGNLSFLVSLDLSENYFHGPLPKDICRYNNLPRLKELQLFNNKLEGEIPVSLGECPQLELLDLSTNNFSGHVPTQIGNITHLRRLILGFNNLRGTIPKEIVLLKKLKVMDLSYNKLSESIPRKVWNMTNLIQLWLSDNFLSGVIQQEIGHLANLQRLDMSSNELSGSLPSAVFNISSLDTIDLSSPIPSFIGNLTNLEYLGLSSNKLNGPIPSTIGNLSNLNHLSLSSNNLNATSEAEGLMRWKFSLSSSASLESWSVNNISNHCRWIGIRCNDEGSVSGIDLSSAGLAGTLDMFHFTALLNLTTFNLSWNALNGSIPAALGNLTSLTLLDLSYNQFYGAIPPKIGGLTELRYLSFSNNSMVGEIPYQIGNLRKAKFLNHCSPIWSNLNILTSPSMVSKALCHQISLTSPS